MRVETYKPPSPSPLTGPPFPYTHGGILSQTGTVHGSKVPSPVRFIIKYFFFKTLELGTLAHRVPDHRVSLGIRGYMGIGGSIEVKVRVVNCLIDSAGEM